MFEPLLIASDTEIRQEFGIFNHKIDRWVVVEDNVVRLSGSSPTSLAHGFPRRGDAGTREFAMALLEWITQGGPADPEWPGLRLEITREGARGCSLTKCRVERPVLIDSGLEIEHLPSDEVMFEIRGPNRIIGNWMDEYQEQFPEEKFHTSIVQVGGGSTMTLRVWRRRKPVPAFA